MKLYRQNFVGYFMGNTLVLTDFYKTTIMKLRLVLVVLLLLPLLAKAQQDKPGTNADPKSGVIFYSKGKMYVKYKTEEAEANKGKSSSTTLYIDGSVKFATGSSIEQKGRTELTGDFINMKDPASFVNNTTHEDAPNLFVNNPTGQNDGVIAFVGKPYDSGGGVMKATRQWIYSVNPDGSNNAWDYQSQKTFNYINFPTISVEKGMPQASDDWSKVGLVTVDASAAIGVNFINVDANNKNRFGIKSTYTSDNRMNSGFALIKDLHTDIKDKAIPEATYSQVDFNLYDYDPTGSIDDGAFDGDGYVGDRPAIDLTKNGRSLRTDASNVTVGAGWNRLVGFSPPFKELAADYMFYHVLTKPNGSSLTSWEGPVVDPFFKMQAGRGYFITMELSHADHKSVIDPRWDFENDLSAANTGIHHSRRARGGYVFNRLTFEDYASKIGGPQENFRRYTYTGTPKAGTPTWDNRDRVDVLQSEKFNVKDPIQVNLAPGLNFLGNPFMAPISLNFLLGWQLPANYHGDASKYPAVPITQENYNAELFGNVKVSSQSMLTGDVRSKYWLINQAYAKYDPTDNVFLYKVTYDYISREAGASSDYEYKNSSTLPITKPEEYVIAPMQMFCLQASKEVTITFDPAMRTFGRTYFPKSASSSDSFDEFKKDWFMVEAEDEISRLADRTTVILNDNATLKAVNDPFDTKKGLGEVGDDKFDSYEQIDFPDANGYVASYKQDVPKAILYTKSSDNIAMLGNAVPKRTKELPLYFDQPEKSKLMKLRFYGIENMESVPGVWLIDRHLNNKRVEITPGFEYSFESAPNDTEGLAGGNRFILQFYADDTDVINDVNTPIVCYYNTSMLYIKGLIEDDINSDLTIYDMQGRLMAKTKINNAPSMEFLKPLSLGTYVVKITGKRNHTAKFVNLQTN